MSFPPPSEALLQASADDLQIDAVHRQVTLQGRALKLGGRAFDLLATLAARPGRVFTAEELQQAVWPGRVLEESNLRAQIRKLRQAVGEQRVVNISGRGYVFLGLDEGHVQAAAATAPSAALPAPSTGLLGRDADLAALGPLLARHGLVTLLGAGGIGKTQLALALAHQARAAGRGGVWWIELAPLRSPAQLALALAQGLQLQPGRLEGPDAGQQLGEAMAGHDGLLVLDNAEQVCTELAQLLARALPMAPGLRVLVTSQQRLRLPSEQVYRLDALSDEAASALLLRRAQAVDHRFRLAEGDTERLTRLCRRLDCLPLALEMAGARLPTLGLSALIAHLDDRLRLLSNDVATAPTRQQTLESALAWSHGLLSAEEQAVLRRLSVFASSFTLASAQAVAADGPVDPVTVVQAVGVLVDRSLLQAIEAAPGSSERRFRLLETTRLYTARQLDEQRERGPAEARHAKAMAQRAEVAQAEFWTHSDGAWMSAWSVDHDDFVLAFDRACEVGDAASAAVLLEALQHEANISGLFTTVQDRVDTALALLPQAGPLARARIWNRGTMRCSHLGKADAARRRVQAWRLVGEPMALARAIAWCAKEEFRAGQPEAAQQLLAEVGALEQAHWPPRQRMQGVAQAELDIAALRTDAPALRQAARTWQALAQQGGMVRLGAQAMNALAVADILLGQHDRALVQFQLITARYRALGSPVDVAYVLCNQVTLLSKLGRTGQALDLLVQALLTTREDYAMARLTEAGATLAAACGEWSESARWLTAARNFERLQASPVSTWKAQILADTRHTVARHLPPASGERCQLEGAALNTTTAHRQMLEWARAAQVGIAFPLAEPSERPPAFTLSLPGRGAG